MRSFTLKLTWANLVARPLSTILTIATLAAAVALISILLQFSNHANERLDRDLAGVDLVVGAKGSPLQLILSSLLHIDVPTGNIPLSEAQAIMREPHVKTAVPLALGDSFRGFRIVGSSEGFLTLYQASLSVGSMWDKPQEVVIGAEVANALGMAIGQKFVGGHGLSFSDAELAEHDHAAYEVVGILKPQASIVDRLILTSVDSVWIAHGEGVENHEEDDHDEAHHDEAHHEEDHHEDDGHDHEEHDHGDSTVSNLRTMDPHDLAVTALLVQYSSPMGAVTMPRKINNRPGLQAAAPALEITRLFNLSAGMMDAGKLMAAIMTIIGGLSIFVAVSNAAVHKLYDIALLRAMGARPKDIFVQQIIEGVIVAFLSGLIGIGFAHLALMVAAAVYDPLAVFGLTGGAFYTQELYLFVGTIIVGMVAAIWPAISSYRVDPMLLLKGMR